MNFKLLIRTGAQQQYQWLDFADPLPRPIDGGHELLDRVCSEHDEIAVLVPAQKSLLTEVAFAAQERKMLRKTLPYSLEDELVDDVDTLHFALGQAGEKRVPVAVINRDELKHLLDSVESGGAEVKVAIAELQALPLKDGHWTVVIDADRWLVRAGFAEGFAMEPTAAPMAIRLLLNDAATRPVQLDIYCDEQYQATVLDQLPEPLREVVAFHEADYWSAVVEACRAENFAPINLLQGDFVRRLPWLKWWQQWKKVAVLAAVALTVHVIAALLQWHSLQQENVALRSEIEAVYRAVVPRGAIVDPERQLRRKVGQSQGVQGEGFVSMLSKIGEAVAAVSDVQLQNINYTEQQSEVRLTLTLPSFNDVEKLRMNIEKKGLKAELTGSDRDGSKTRARLRVKG